MVYEDIKLTKKELDLLNREVGTVFSETLAKIYLEKSREGNKVIKIYDDKDKFVYEKVTKHIILSCLMKFRKLFDEWEIKKLSDIDRLLDFFSVDYVKGTPDFIVINNIDRRIFFVEVKAGSKTSYNRQKETMKTLSFQGFTCYLLRTEFLNIDDTHKINYGIIDKGRTRLIEEEKGYLSKKGKAYYIKPYKRKIKE